MAENKNEVSSDFETLCIIELAPEIQAITSDWLIAKIQLPKLTGGAELIVNAVVKNESTKETILHVGATIQRLLEAAELLEIKKVHNDGLLREFTCKNLDNFLGEDGDVDLLLSTSERQWIVYHELMNIRAQGHDPCIKGFPEKHLYSGQSIIRKCLKHEIIRQMFPLHQKEELKLLACHWCYKLFSKQPIDEIKKYFGCAIAMYFSFLGFYTMALVPSAVIGLFKLITGWGHLNTFLILCVFNLIWVTIFLESWKRKCNTLAYKWGTIGQVTYEEARPAFRGTMGINPVTMRYEPIYPAWKRLLWIYGISMPVVIFCLCIATCVMLIYFHFQSIVDLWHSEDPRFVNLILVYVPSCVYAVVIGILNSIYRRLARRLTEKENHRLQTSHENHLIVKLVLFDFVNCFLSLFYVAFYLQDLEKLKMHLATLLIVQQVVGQVQEVVLPFLLTYFRKKSFKSNHAKTKIPSTSQYVHSDQLTQTDLERSLDVYEGTFDDYLELFLQFGYVFMFSSVFPLAAFCALVNNVIEIRTDAFKLCKNFQRPFATPATNIGAWQNVFELMGAIAVITNCGLVFISPQLNSYFPDVPSTHLILTLVAVEHILLAIKCFIAFVIPDCPEWIDVAIAKIDYESKQALKKERSDSSKYHLCMSKKAKSKSLNKKKI